jgi:hypothetical protein
LQKLTLVFFFLIVPLLAVLEYFVSWTADISKIASFPSNYLPSYVTASLTAFAWSPIFAGVVLGLLQLPSLYFTQTALGASGSYVTIAGYLLGLVDKDRDTHTPYFKPFIGSPSHCYQVFVVCGISLGALVSCLLSGGPGVAIFPPSSSVLLGYFGGFIMVFGLFCVDSLSSRLGCSLTYSTSPFLFVCLAPSGARLGGGCTSGHGISGIAQLSVPSLFVVVAMFTGFLGMGLIL